MNRRLFCGATLGFAATYPLLAGPGRLVAAPAVAGANISAVSLEGAALELEKAVINEFADSLSGEVLLPGHPAYDEVRRVKYSAFMPIGTRACRTTCTSARLCSRCRTARRWC